MAESRIRVSKDLELFVHEFGPYSDPPLLIVHGGPDWDSSYLLPVAKALARRRRVYLFDMRGCGKSGRCAEVSDYTRSTACSDIVALVQELGFKQVHLLGFSFGGRIALHAAHTEPSRFCSLILASTSPLAEVRWSLEPRERRQRRSNTPDLKSLLKGPEQELSSRVRLLALQSLPMDVWNLKKLKEIRNRVGGVDFSGEWSRAFVHGHLAPDLTDYVKWLKESRIPTLVIHGAKDFRFPSYAWHPLQRESHISIRILRNCGHLAPLERAAKWTQIVERFLRQAGPTNQSRRAEGFGRSSH